MRTLILDLGSGNTCRNDLGIIERLIDSVAWADHSNSKNLKIILKWQLFTNMHPNIPLWTQSFSHAYEYAAQLGYQTTASVFDRTMLKWLLGFSIPFVKIACLPALWYLLYDVPPEIPIIYSYPANGEEKMIRPPINSRGMACVRKYPAVADDYQQNFSQDALQAGLSDHTADWTLYHTYHPYLYECHVKLEDSTGPDAGPFARTPAQLKEILDG